MTTLTESPEDALKSAISTVDETNQWVKNMTDGLQKAQTRASDAQNFVAAADLEYQNADAKFLVLQELFDKQNQLAGQLADAENDAAQAKATQSSINKTLAALKRATAAAQKLASSAQTAVDDLGTLHAALTTAAAARPNGQKSELTNAARKVETLQKRLSTEQKKLTNELATANADYAAVPPITGIKELDAKVASLKKELQSAKLDKGKGPVISKADVDKAKADRDSAQLLKDQAPATAQDAQAEVSAKQSELYGAQTAYNAAVKAFEQVEEKFIDKIVVTGPDATGFATATAVLKPGMTIPDGYKLQWQTGGAPITYPTEGSTLQVKIDANALPIGNTPISATIVKATTKDQP
jgi:hypothetical protein